MGILDELFSDPRATILFLLLALPGRLLAIAAHESAHGLMAERCGDPTARMMGRITLNPLKHLDPVGLFCFVFLGIGWAKPVPVNPRNYRDARRDDFKVSIAGICANLLMFLAGCIVMYAVLAGTLASLPLLDRTTTDAALMRASIGGTPALVVEDGWYRIIDLLQNAPWVADILIAPRFGRFAGYAFEMLGYFVMTNLVLAVFNLIPLPPLDGYHVLNDLLFRRELFASPTAQAVCSVILYAGVFTGVLSTVLEKVYTFVLSGLGSGVLYLLTSMGLF